MSTVSQIYEQLCQDDQITEGRRKNFRWTLRHLAAAFNSTPETCIITNDLEGTYADRLAEYLTAQGKHLTKDGKPSVAIRNAVQETKQFLELYHSIMQTAVVPVVVEKVKPPRWDAARKEMASTSPYTHQGWMTQSKYVLPPKEWPDEVKGRFAQWRQLKKDDIKPSTVSGFTVALESLLGYLHLTGEERLRRLHPEAQKKITLDAYADDREQILSTRQTVAWGDLFVLEHIKSFITWHAWRKHTPEDAKVSTLEPSKPSTLGLLVATSIMRMADTMHRQAADVLEKHQPKRGKVAHEHAEKVAEAKEAMKVYQEREKIRDYRNKLEPPKKIHNKKAEYHRFTLDELEQVGLALMDESRHMDIRTTFNGKKPVEHQGAYAAARFQTGLILFMAVRNPMRARNWCEALLDKNLMKVNGAYRWHFEGRELKVAKRGREMNVHDVWIDAETLPHLLEYLKTWRPLMPGAGTDRHVFLRTRTGKGGAVSGALTVKTLYQRLKVHVYRHTKKRLFTHLLRTIFTSQMFRVGANFNFMMHFTNDGQRALMGHYNEVFSDVEEADFDEMYARTKKANGNGHTNGKAS